MVACIDTEVVFTCCQDDVDRLARGDISIAVRLTINTEAWRAQHEIASVEAGWELHRIGAGLEIGEDVVTAGIRQSGADGCACGVEQRDCHALDAGLAQILGTIAICIAPHKVTQ